jgi:type IV pilus assembly protein PilB
VVASNPENVVALDDIAITTGYKVRGAVASPEDIEAVINQLSNLEASVREVAEETPDDHRDAAVIELRESAEEGPVVKLVHSIIADAVGRGASDIHFDPGRDGMRVRFRIDGVAVDSATVPRRLASGVVSRIKIMAELDIAERRTPQDGRIGLTVDGRPIDIRVATLPVVNGESVVVRILDKQAFVADLDLLGMAPAHRALLSRSLKQLHGAVLVTGPTGAGKTTTLYAALNDINTPDRTIITIEDPVEYELDGVKQVQVNLAAGLTFVRGLRSMIRNDPDVLMVGEIRDRETAQTAIESALTGHLVLSTLHTNDAPMAPVRLIDMGIEPFLVATGVECVIAQRLARRLCEECRRPARVGIEELRSSGFHHAVGEIDAYEAVGCGRCGGIGYRGRIGIYEVMPLSKELRTLILRKASSEEIAAAAVSAGMRRLREDGLDKVRQGITSIPEMLRVIGTDGMAGAEG